MRTLAPVMGSATQDAENDGRADPECCELLSGNDGSKPACAGWSKTTLSAVLTAAILLPLACLAAKYALPIPCEIAEDPPGSGLELFDRYYIEHGGLNRSYWVYVPPELKGHSPDGMVLFFHGFTNTVNQTCGSEGEAWPSFNVRANARRERFIAVCPEGYAPPGDQTVGWNCDACCGYSSNHQLDDVDFVRTMLAELKDKVLPSKKLEYPARNVFSMGFSVGGLFSYRLSCELNDLIHGIGVIGAQYGSAFGSLLPMTWEAKCPESGGTNVWNGIGTNDIFMNRAGGTDAAVTGWQKYSTETLDCNGPVRHFSPSVGVNCSSHPSCPGGKRSELCLYDKMDHTVNDTRAGFGYGVARVAWRFLAQSKTATTPAPPEGGWPGAKFSIEGYLRGRR
mmetsp:Transcript_57329/g.147441  ORF Transcript_57329/g.147441 Transcript_57329/m.147441 type:complete len:395 (-) Transcript_57329:309-1493(-)